MFETLFYAVICVKKWSDDDDEYFLWEDRI
jgi:hypothetical protein